ALGVTVSDGSLTSAPEIVRILVTDENDTPPVIGPGQVFSITENAPEIVEIGTVHADDVDTVGTLQDFTIVSGNPTGIWGIDPATGKLFTFKGSELDYEGQKTYILGIQVSDGVNLSAVQTIKINLTDQNDVPPVVLPATLSVPENS